MTFFPCLQGLLELIQKKIENQAHQLEQRHPLSDPLLPAQPVQPVQWWESSAILATVFFNTSVPWPNLPSSVLPETFLGKTRDGQ